MIAPGWPGFKGQASIMVASFLIIFLAQESLCQIQAGGYDPFASRTAPKWPERADSDDMPSYVISSDRLDEIRKQKMYPFFDKGGNDGNGDFQLNIRDTQPQLNKQLNFLLPFFGFGFNYTWLSLHGSLSFSETPIQFPEYPLVFPIPDWPKKDDPSFIGIFYSRCKIGELNGNEVEEYAKRRPGVYFRLERDLYSRKDQFGVELRERTMWDIRESMVGTETFEPKHIIIATWKNVSFGGGIPSARRITNTFQAVIVTDEVRTYAMFIYEWMGWTTHTEAGGDTTEGQGGTPAFIGFNAGNGTRSYQYLPYSQTTFIRDLPGTGNANNFPGRHIFRIDEKILPGVCIRDLIGTNLPLTFAPENGHMLGGSMVNLTGPCFQPMMRITCRFNTKDSEGIVIDENRAVCIMPWTEAEGWVDFEVSLSGGPFYWKGRFFVEAPSVSPPLVWFKDELHHTLNPGSLRLMWDPFNLTMRSDAKVTISLWGYKESHIKPELLYIDVLEDNENNDGELMMIPRDYADRDNGQELRMCEMGFIKINLTVPFEGMLTSPAIWSRPMPLGWYFNEQWRRYEGNNWIQEHCDTWIKRDRMLKNFANELPMCPCLLRQAIADRGRYAPDFDCDTDGNTQCFYHQGAQHCVTTGLPNHDGAGQQCCYDLAGYLMLTSDNKWGGNPLRNHNLGLLPWNEANKIPTLSHWLSDVIPFYPCCLWQEEQSVGCQRYRFERRASQDCVGYQPPGGATVFGDPHFYTFDGMPYTFNGKGEYVLVRADSPRVKLDVQGRFEQVWDSPYGEVLASQLTAVAAKDNVSSVVEVRLRPLHAQWRYKLDVIVDGTPIYFDRYPQKIQHFPGVTVYTPSNILNQSHVVMMFQSGAGVEVLENKHYMAARVYLPWEFINQTRGLFGNWTFDIQDDFTLPNGQYGSTFTTNDLQSIHKNFATKWVVHDKEEPGIGKSLFTHNNGQSSNSFYDTDFEPEYNILPVIPPNVTWVNAKIVEDTCGESYQCKYDYSTSLSREFAIFTKYYQDSFVNIREGVLKPEARVISCGSLPTPAYGRKSTFAFTPGTMVKFDCDPDYVLTGERRRWCYDSGDWNWAEKGEALCIPQSLYNSQMSGITAAIVICILLPLGICAFCLIMKLRERAAEKNDNGGGTRKKTAGPRFGPSAPNRASANSFGGRKNRSSESDRDSGFHANGKVTVADRNNSDDDVRYNREQYQRDAPEQDSLKAGSRLPLSLPDKAESYSDSKGSSISDLVNLESPPAPGKRTTSPSLEDVVRNRAPVTRLPSSSGRSTPSSPTSIAPSKPLPPRPTTTTVQPPRSISTNFQPTQPLRGSGRSTSSDRLLSDRKPDSLPLLTQIPLGSVPKQPLSTSTSNASSNFQPQQPARGSGRSTSSSNISDPRNVGAIPKSAMKKGPGSLTSSSASSPPPPLPTTLPPPTDNSDESDVNPSDFDGSYYTNEPLSNKPDVKFPPKKLEAEIDIKNYKPYVAPTKKPSAL